jgi:hypothetical protein
MCPYNLIYEDNTNPSRNKTTCSIDPEFPPISLSSFSIRKALILKKCQEYKSIRFFSILN